VKLTVIIPIYNVEEYLKECINSIIAEEIKSLEIIGVNDGSTDKSLDILKKIKAQNKNINIKIINQKNSGISVARNKGLKEAKGEYVYFIDSDDFLQKNGLKILLKEIEKEDADIIRGDYVEYYDEKKIIRVNKIQNNMSEGREYLIENRHNFIPMVWNSIYRTSFLKKNNLKFMENILNEDVEFNFKACYLAEKIIEKKVFMYNYRQRNNSIMSAESLLEKRKIEFIKSSYEVANSLNKFLMEKKEKNKILKKMVFRYYFNIFTLSNKFKLELKKIDFILKKLKVKNLLKVAPSIKDKRNVYLMCWFPYYFFNRRYKKRRR